MARLTKTERAQLRQASRTKSSAARPGRSSSADYLAFATFAARFVPATKVKPMSGGSHWKL